MEKIDAQFFDVTLERIKDFGNDTKHFQLKLPEGQSLQFYAGQFVAVLCPQGEKTIRRAYSIATPPSESEHIGLVIKLVKTGTVTNWFWTLEEGDTFQIHAPFGKFVLPETVDFDPVFVAIGTGIAPFRSMIHDLLSQGFERDIYLIFGARFDAHIPYHDEFVQLAQAHPNLHYVPTVSRPSETWTGETGYVQTKLEHVLGSASGKQVYICGLNDMIQAVRTTCLELGFEDSQIEYEKYD